MTPLTMLGRYPTRFACVTQISAAVFQPDLLTKSDDLWFRQMTPDDWAGYLFLFQFVRKCATKLHGLVAASSCDCKILSHAVLQAPVEPGIQKISVRFAIPATARD